MKILYIGSEHSDAQVVATVLRSVDDTVTVLWASHLDQAVRGLDENRDLSALVVDVQVNDGSWSAIVSHARSLASRPAIVAILPHGSDEPLPGVDGCVLRSHSLPRDLPIVLTRSLEHATRVDLEQKLTYTTSALEQAEQRRRIAADQLAALEAQYEVGAARAAATWEMVDEQLRTAALEVERARQSQAAAAADVERLTRRDAELSSQLAYAIEARDTLAQRLVERQQEFESQLAQEAERRRSVEASLANAIRVRDDAQKRHGLAMTEAAARARELQEALRVAGEGVTSKAAEIERLTAREKELSAEFSELTTRRQDLERRLGATQAAFDDATMRATRERLAASKKAADREAELDGLLLEERTKRSDLEHTIAESGTSLRETQQRHEAALAAATSQRDQLTRREAELAAQLEEARGTHSTLEQSIADAERALRDAENVHATVLATAAAELRERDEHLARREAELTSQLTDVQDSRDALERQLATADASLRDAQQRHQTALAAAAAKLAKRQSHFDRELSEITSERDQLAQREANLASQLEEALVARRAVEQSAATELKERDERLARREAELTSQLTDVQDSRDALERQLATADASLRDAQQRHEAALAAAAEQLAKRQSHFDRELSEITSERDQLAQREANLASQLEEALVARRALEQSAETDLKERDERLAKREAELTAQLTDVQASRDALERELSEMTDERDQLAQRESDLASQLEQARTAHSALEQSAATDIKDRDARLAQREAELTSQLSDVQGSRDALERQLADADASLRDAQQRHDSALATAAEDLANRVADFDRALLDAVDEHDRLTRQLHDSDAALHQVQRQYDTTVADVERLTDRATDLVAQLADVQAAHDTIERQLADAKAAAVDRESQFAICVAQEQLEHETRLSEAGERHRALTLERETLQQQLSALNEQVLQLRHAMSASAEQLEASRLESDRLFDQAGVAMFRCTRDGAFTEVNRACATLIGRRMLDDGIDIAAAVFEDPNVLTWLIERCLTTRTRESLETTWRRPDGSRLSMRLSARSLPGTVEVVAEDLTRLRVLEERLARAQRMEAVGRFAQEVAVTCGGLLDSLHQKGRDWLANGGADSRVDGERLFDDIGRAAALLRELAACGDEQARTPMQVDLNTLIRDLEPVLKRVAGGDVEVQLRDTSSPLTVDVGIERVERLLVNLASYGRGRMPSGGRLKIELGTSVVDRRFAAKHPNVRLGLHALITVTETGHPSGVDQGREKPAARSGVDFGTLQGLVSECGGHLWMKVQPLGDMVAKIRLPLLSAREHALPRLASRMARARTSGRWLQS